MTAGVVLQRPEGAAAVHAMAVLVSAGASTLRALLQRMHAQKQPQQQSQRAADGAREEGGSSTRRYYGLDCAAGESLRYPLRHGGARRDEGAGGGARQDRARSGGAHGERAFTAAVAPVTQSPTQLALRRR